jgi:3-hydroxyisobutyrate dehydrogenase-like beta-hydroxyacid dehydrogenase
MNPIVAIVAPGNMGAGVGGRLVEHGLTVRTSLAGRSPASIARAREAGMVDADDDVLAASDFILSIVPPDRALAQARLLAPALARAPRKPVYVDCNAISPATAEEVAAVIAPTGTGFVDAGIIGLVPKGGYDPVFYASGPAAGAFARLAEYGLDVRVLDGPAGTASALKLCYAGITKGITAVATAMLLAADRAGVADALRAELAASQAPLLQRFVQTVPGMYSKAYRWVGEMLEIAQFAGDEQGAGSIYRGAAELYRAFAADDESALTGALDRFLAPPG